MLPRRPQALHQQGRRAVLNDVWCRGFFRRSFARLQGRFPHGASYHSNIASSHDDRSTEPPLVRVFHSLPSQAAPLQLDAPLSGPLFWSSLLALLYRLLTEHLGIKHLRAIIGFSMGGMHVWQWAQQYSNMMDIAVPLASLPTEMSGRNWMMRRLIIDSIRNDPDWLEGNYLQQPASLQFASAFYSIATNGGNLAIAKAANTRANADALLDLSLIHI